MTNRIMYNFFIYSLLKQAKFSLPTTYFLDDYLLTTTY
jgi:hypothetical protein